MTRIMRFAALCAGLALLLMIGFSTSRSGSVRAQEDDATLTIHSRVCPPGYAGPDYYETCHDTPGTGTPFALDGPVSQQGEADGNGDLVFAQLPAGSYSISGGVATDFGDLWVFCSRSDDPGDEYPSSTAAEAGGPSSFVTTLDLAAGDSIVCDFYVISPGSGDGSSADGSPVADTIDFTIGVMNCETETDFRRSDQTSLPAGCMAGAGITVTVSLTDGTAVGSCTTDDSGGCTIEAPDGAEVTVSEDETTIPAGYVPQENPVSATVATEFAGAELANVLQSNNATASTPATEPTQDTLPGRTAGIYAGTCSNDLGDAVVELTDVAQPSGSPEGSSDAIPAGSSFTTVDLSLDDLLGDDYVIAVADEAGDGWSVCGAIGGTRSDDGVLAIGLGNVDDSEETGIAYLSPNGDQTDLSIFIAEPGSPATATPEASSHVAPSPV